MSAPPPNETSRDRLIERHLSLVLAMAGKLKRTFGLLVDVEDLIGCGARGLVEAADRFDPARGTSFSTFAYYRIRGAMLDGLRTMGSFAARRRTEGRVNEYLQYRNEDSPAGGAPASGPPDLVASLESLAAILGGIAAIHMASRPEMHALLDAHLQPPDAHLERRDTAARVRRAIDRLPDKERRLIHLYYFADQSLQEAGAQLGLSRSWACRLHARAVDLLRDTLMPEASGGGVAPSSGPPD
jgi:RNA polymerase sigma factor for flagellar operon FliA